MATCLCTKWIEGTLVPLTCVQHAPTWAFDAEIKKRDAELQQYLAQGPPESAAAFPELARGSKEEPITWLFEPESFAPMAKLVGGAAFSIVTDHLGTPVSMLDGDGAGVWSAEISTYGELRGLHGRRREQSSARHACPFRFPGSMRMRRRGFITTGFAILIRRWGGMSRRIRLGWRGVMPFTPIRSTPLAQRIRSGFRRRAGERPAAWCPATPHTTASRPLPSASFYRRVAAQGPQGTAHRYAVDVELRARQVGNVWSHTGVGVAFTPDSPRAVIVPNPERGPVSARQRGTIAAKRALCTVTGHPVDVATSSYRSPRGHGWHHSYDLVLT